MDAPLQVEVGGDIETAIRFFKKVVAKDGIHAQIKRRLAFAKPSERRREKMRVTMRRIKKKEGGRCLVSQNRIAL